jgi:hypothetical protein
MPDKADSTVRAANGLSGHLAHAHGFNLAKPDSLAWISRQIEAIPAATPATTAAIHTATASFAPSQYRRVAL